MDSHTEDLLNLYVDGELPLEDQGALFARLAESPEARVQFGALMDFRLATRLDANPVPPAVDEALFRRIDGLRSGTQRATQRAEDRRPFRTLRRRVTVGAALAALLAVLALGALVPSPEPTETVRIVSIEHAEPVYVIYPGVTIEDDTLVGQ